MKEEARQPARPWQFPVPPFRWSPPTELEEEQKINAAVNARLFWHVVAPIRRLEDFVCPIRSGSTSPGVYIIARRDAPNRWTIRKVGESGNLRNRICDARAHLDGCRQGPPLDIPGLPETATYRQLLANGHTLFYSFMFRPDTTPGQPPQFVGDPQVAKSVEKLIARTLARGGMVPSHHADISRIDEAVSDALIINVLPPFLLRALQADVQAAAPPFWSYPRGSSPGFTAATNTIFLRSGEQSWETSP